MVSWTDKEKPFCEGYLYENEYANSFTSLFIVFIGLYGLYFNIHPFVYLKHYFTLFVINGIASFAFHWSLQKGWGLYDAFPMFILAYYGMFFGLDIILHKELFFKRRQLYLYLSSLSSLLCNTIMICSMIYTSIYGQQTAVFAILFALPILVTVSTCFIVWYVYYDDYKGFNEENFVSLQKLIIRALIIGVVTATGWFATELTCEEYKFPRYLYLHTFWHIGFSYSMYCFLIYILFLYSVNNKIKLEFKKHDNKYLNFLFHILPVLEYMPNQINENNRTIEILVT